MEIKNNNVSVVYTDAAIEKIIKEDSYSKDSIVLMIMSKIMIDKQHESNHLLGDVMINNEKENYYGLIVKNRPNDKIMKEAMRLTLVRLLNSFIEEKVKVNNIFINRHHFTDKEIEIFRLVLTELIISLPKNKYIDKILLIISNPIGGDEDENDIEC